MGEGKTIQRMEKKKWRKERREGGREGGRKGQEKLWIWICSIFSLSSQLTFFDALLYKTRLNEIKLLFACLGTGSPSVASAGINPPISTFQVLKSWA